MLHVSVARSSSDTFTIGRITCHREGVFFPTENALLAGKGNGSTQRGRSMLSTIALLLLYSDMYSNVVRLNVAKKTEFQQFLLRYECNKEASDIDK